MHVVISINLRLAPIGIEDEEGGGKDSIFDDNEHNVAEVNIISSECK